MPHFDPDWEIEFAQLQNRLREIKSRIFTPCVPIEDIYQCVTGPGKGPERIPKRGWSPFRVMERWGGYDQTTWFWLNPKLPESFVGERIVALLRLADHTHIVGMGPRAEAGEALAYLGGKPYQGIDRNHDFMILTDKARPDERFDIVLECCPSTRFDATHVFSRADLAVMHPDVWDFYWDGQVLLDVIRHLPSEKTACRRLFMAVSEALLAVDLQHADSPLFHKSMLTARRRLAAALRDFPADAHSGALTLIGHSHIDTAWLWPLRETRRKVGRTFATVLRLMEQYPEYHFSASQPELYMFVKENHPEIWRGIKRRVREGRWEPCGATWVEQDSNVPCGEAIIRHLLYGNRFYQQEFGKRSRAAWLPDAFGYPWSLPQLLKKSGVDTFYTIKLSWSRFTKFPFGYFLWQGVDGARIRAVMPPLNYNGDPTPENCSRQWEEFAQKHLAPEVPFSYGYGDGGGGPTPRMIEYGKRLGNIVGVPRCAFGRAQDCLDRMRAHTPDEALPVYNGELYLELHRGCQTTQARAKRNNRKCEGLLHSVEMLAAHAWLLGKPYDHEQINRCWRILLTHQFHDILPGSSITEVYADADRNYGVIRDALAAQQAEVVQHLSRHMDIPGDAVPLLVHNPLSWERQDVVELSVPLPEGPFHVLSSGGKTCLSQRTHDNKLLFIPAEPAPPAGFALYRLVAGPAPSEPRSDLKVSPRKLENASIALTLDNYGRFRRVYDKRYRREVLAAGERGNRLQLFDDRPAANDAWDIDHNFEMIAWEPGPAESLTLLEKGPVRAVARVTRRTEKSVFTQDITLYAGSPRIEVGNHVDWHEKRCLLKVAFPVEVLSPRATYHIQFGTVERATHENTAFDHARFEVAGHHWVDLSEAGYGVSLLNDCKYGHDARGNVLRLSLLRSPVDPDPHADEGEHRFTYALLPHEGDWRGATVREGYALNAPLAAYALSSGGNQSACPASLATIDGDSVILETVKKAEDSDALVFRLYEAHGGRRAVRVTFGFDVDRVAECDLMEEAPQPLNIGPSNALCLQFKPYEIRSLLVFPRIRR